MGNGTGSNSGAALPKEPSALQPPQIAVPMGGGAIQSIGEKFSVNVANGTGTLSLQIAASPGRSGFGPQLSLSYDSGSGNGPFGFGWSLGAPTITRKTDKGLPRYADFGNSDVFILSGAEDLVPVSDAPPGRTLTVNATKYTIVQYRPRVESLFARIERWTSDKGETHWRTISRDNVTTLYGHDENSRIQDRARDPKLPWDQPRIFSWLISRSFDDKGNVAVYDYVPETAADITQLSTHEANRSLTDRCRQRYLKSIRYGNAEPYFPDWSEKVPEVALPANWYFQLVFDYGDHTSDAPTPVPDRPWRLRPDPFSNHRAGFEVRTYRRVKRVLMFHHFPKEADVGNNCLVRSTDFLYSDDLAPPDPGAPIYTFLQSATETGHLRQGPIFVPRSLPPVEFEYSVPKIHPEVLTLDTQSAHNLPEGIDGSRYQWVDLDGDGAGGVLTDWGGSWGYRRNLSPANKIVQPDGSRTTRVRLGALETVQELPSRSDLAGQHLLDLSGDGQLDIVALDEPNPGFFERTERAGWAPLRRFASLPSIRWNEPNLRFVDLTGDGLADVMITEDGVFTFYPSRGAEGFGPAERVCVPWDETRGPTVVMADGTQTIFLADMSGDSLTDLVRVRNGEVCYWPNLGYGRFGDKVEMDNAPRFVNEERFDPKRIRLSDIDGSGSTDLLYVGDDGIWVCFNQSGNGWAVPQRLDIFPGKDELSSVQVLDLLGNGTACLVWSSPLAAESYSPLRYVDLMGGKKPHLLITSRNSLGAETRVRYAPSTQFYVEDRLAGRPWITRLPHIVHVVSRLENYDYVGRTRLVSRYAYHHGYFDGPEREFRGFGLVEQWDTEEHSSDSDFPHAKPGNWDTASWSPPTLTRSWFHTGAFLDAASISQQYSQEYWSEPGLSAMLLPDTVLEEAGQLSPQEIREAYRALKGSPLRIETYALDKTVAASNPYTVTEQNFAVRCLQRRGSNRHAVFLTHPRESIEYHYERNPADPRVTHSMTLQVDGYGNVLKSLSVGYGRRNGQSPLRSADRTTQEQLLITCTETDFTQPVDDLGQAPHEYRTPLVAEVRTYEITGFAPTAGRFAFDDFAANAFLPLTSLTEAQYEDPVDYSKKQKRLIERVRTLYRKRDLSGLFALGSMDAVALPGETYKQAFTAGLAKRTYVESGKLSQADLDAALVGDAKYLRNPGETDWWLPSGQTFYSTGSADTPAQELAYARAHFFLPLRYRNPFHTAAVPTEMLIAYDPYDLLVQQTLDPLGNCMTAGTRKLDDTLNISGNDYRVLQPRLTMDANRACTQVVFDTLGLVVGTAVMGTPEDNPAQGDLIDAGFRADLAAPDIDPFYATPQTQATGLLAKATTRIVYDVDRYRRSRAANPADPTRWEAVFAATLARETHVADLVREADTNIQIRFAYFDGFGREIQKKAQAEPGPVPTRDANGAIIVGADGQPVMGAAAATRWVGSGWTVFSNKGKPVRQFEPFFSDTHKPDFDLRIGVTPALFYDPAERLIATLHPDGTYEKIVFDPWRQATHDANDTVALDPRTDPDIGGVVRNYFATLSGTWKTWLQQRVANPLNPPADSDGRIPQQDVAVRALAHAGTPTVAHFDVLGRTFLTFADNGPDPASPGQHLLFAIRLTLDIQGNQRAVSDAKGRTAMRYDYDMLSQRTAQFGMDAGARWVLNDVVGRPLRSWDSRGHAFQSTYDPLRRPLTKSVQGFDPANSDPRTLGGPVVFEKVQYGEGQAAGLNLAQRVFRTYDGAGIATHAAYDFKGNLLRSTRQFVKDFTALPDWSAGTLDATYSFSTTYDALNCPLTNTTPDASVARHTFNAASLLERVDVNLRGAAATTAFVTNIDYDAKGRRARIDYGTQDGKGISTTYAYDSLTFRLTASNTTRNAAAFDATDRPGQAQALSYVYDPVGNITHITDGAQDTIYFRNRKVEPRNDYVYDALYRLITATGRQHLGQNGKPVRHSYNDANCTGLLSAAGGNFAPNDGTAMGTYREIYQYDEVGNFLQMQHVGSDPADPGWTRHYTYNEGSLLEGGQESNRLTSTDFGGSDFEVYSATGDGYDPHGNPRKMPHLAAMQWDFRDRLLMTQRQQVNPQDVDGGAHQGEKTYYVYDSTGQRMRKTTIRQVPPGAVQTRMKERIYLGGYEVYREYANDGTTVSLERQTLHVLDDQRRVALFETKNSRQRGARRRSHHTHSLSARQSPRNRGAGAG